MLKRGFLYQGQRYEWQRKPRGTEVKTSRPMDSSFTFRTMIKSAIACTANAYISKRVRAGIARSWLCFSWLRKRRCCSWGKKSGRDESLLCFSSIMRDRKSVQGVSGAKNIPRSVPELCHSGSAAGHLGSERFHNIRAIEIGRWRGRYSRLLCIAFIADLLRLRREDLVISSQARDRLDGAVLGSHALAVRYLGVGGSDRLLVLNLGQDLHYVPAPEPLLAPRSDGYWQMIWTSDDPRYGGPGASNPLTEQGWHVPAESAWLFRMERAGTSVLQEGENG